MLDKTSEIIKTKGDNTEWFDNESIDKFRRRQRRLRDSRTIAFGFLSCGFLILASLQIWLGLSMLLFLGFFIATIISIVIDSIISLKN